ncbi:MULTISPECIES: LacI family DNA-binding transcriptional regulator [Olivibacter]|uniref:Transcriptional regulator, LacI family n=2 Tax=Sphingobacteriaceae TaxID=84566 RepID=F4C4X8_SPHS2|nr:MULTISPECIES: LacI family DNA-binding transcriptional regulator [Olivibacter]MDM8174200.1 LacI family DNA-binding transcriptional regulator [Olivibacter sp. 47]QEL04030.1 LacI family transcriptional regulator [Olivibacter sp. LS-1]
MSNLVTIKDIARALNISVSTVSRALRDAHDVSLETKSKVEAMATALHYKPNFNAMGLANGKSHNIGIVLPFITNYYFSTVITGIQEAAYNNGYNIVLYVTNDSPERELAIINNLSIANLDGLLISTCCKTGDHLQHLLRNKIPIVFFDRVIEKVETSKVVQDDYNGAFLATSHLVEQGYTKIAHIAGPRNLPLTEKRLTGYLDALKKHCLPIREEWIIASGFSQECGESDAMELLQLAKNMKPNAIFAVNDRKAVGASITLKKQGITIGKEIGIIGFTNDPISCLVSPSISTVAEPAFDIGFISCELLLKHITKKQTPCQEIILPAELIVRESTQRA